MPTEHASGNPPGASGAPSPDGPWAVRPARTGDLDAVLALLAAADLPRDGVQEGFGQGFTVAERAGRILGAAGVEIHGQVGLLRSVVVDSTHRGGGLGTALVQDRLAWAGRSGLEGLYLLTTGAAAYFLRFGFRGVDRSYVPSLIRDSVEFRAACPVSATVMYLALPTKAGQEDAQLPGQPSGLSR